MVDAAGKKKTAPSANRDIIWLHNRHEQQGWPDLDMAFSLKNSQNIENRTFSYVIEKSFQSLKYSV